MDWLPRARASLLALLSSRSIRIDLSARPPQSSYLDLSSSALSLSKSLVQISPLPRPVRGPTVPTRSCPATPSWLKACLLPRRLPPKPKRDAHRIPPIGLPGARRPRKSTKRC
ncbi:hypothetical protein IWZ00DRAFT_174532 [Phyllosticta capitalensis]